MREPVDELQSRTWDLRDDLLGVANGVAFVVT